MEDHKLRVFLNRLVKIFAHKKKDMTGGSRQVHNHEFYNFCFTQNIIRLTKARRMRYVRYIAYIEEKQNAYEVLVGRRPLGRLWHRLDDNVKMDLKEIWLECVD
jgi:hypothetical protein